MAALSPTPKLQFFDADGDPLVGGKLYTYRAGTSTPLATYTDSSGSTPNTNPVILDARGECSVWLDGDSAKYVLRDAGDALIWTQDNIGDDTSTLRTDLAAASGASLIGYTQGGVGAVTQTVQDKLRFVLTPADKGAYGDGIQNDTLALQRWAAEPAGIHFLGDASKIYLVDPIAIGDVIIPLTAARRIMGGGAQIKVKSASKQFYAIIGASSSAVDLSGTLIHGAVFDHNSAGNTYTAAANVLTNPHFTVSAKRGSDIEVSDCRVLNAVCTNSLFINGDSSSLSRAKLSHNKFINVGGSGTDHDHSTIYVTADSAEVVGNEGFAAALGTTGAACFIETHSSNTIVSGNVGMDFDGLANITGIYAAGDVVLSQVFGNRGNVLQHGIRLFSASLGAHTTGYGIDGMDVFDNHIRIHQSELPAGTSLFYIGVGVQSGPAFVGGTTLPIRHLTIRDNVVVYDLESSAPAYSAIAPAIGVLETSSNTTFENIVIENNTVVNAPAMAIALGFGNGTFVNCSIGPNRMLNPCQSLAPALSAYKSALWLGGNLYASTLKIDKQEIIDAHSVTRLVSGVMAIPTSDSTACIVDIDLDISLTGDKVAFVSPCNNSGNKTTPLLKARVNKTPAFAAHNFRALSEMHDTTTDLIYRTLTTGQTWPDFGYSTSVPAAGSHAVGSRRVNSVPTVGQPKAWSCTVAGAPGTWVSEGNL